MTSGNMPAGSSTTGFPIPILSQATLICIAILCATSGQITRPAGAAERNEDWPMWRYDAQRSAASANRLPDEELVPIWSRKFAARQQAWDDPLNLDLMTYDRVLEPIVAGGQLMIGFNDTDKLAAFDTETGNELWSAYAESAVRLPPVAWNGHVYFSSDDGFLYCVDMESGDVRWKFSGAPDRQHAIGNRRLTSAWPARGGPVVRDGVVYFAASIWPFMGTFIYALDAESGSVRWVNDSTGAQYIKQPHSAPSFAGVAPQGALVATEDLLLVPGGRSVPAALNRSDGSFRYFEINAGGKGTGGSFVTADEQHFFVHTRLSGTRAFKLEDGVKTAFLPNQPVLHQGIVYSAESKDDAAVVCAYGPDQKLLWQVDADGSGDLILADQQLIAGGKNSITIIQLPDDQQPARVLRTIPIEQQAQRLIVADRKLFVVTLDGQLIAFGGKSTEQVHDVPAIATIQPDANPNAEAVVSASARRAVSQLLAAGEAEGYALWFGSGQAPLAKALATASPFVQLAIVQPTEAGIDEMRRQLDALDRYGAVTLHHSDAGSFQAPSYIANMVFVDCNPLSDRLENVIPELYRSVRPYGGVMHLLGDVDRAQLAAQIKSLKLEQAAIEVGADSVIVRRVGALPGSADWTHQHGDIANTVKSNDSRVKLPLGVLWFGGNSNMDVLPRHGHGPPEQVVGGRLFIQGMNSLSARDVYTGRVLWKREFGDLGTFDVYYDSTYDDTPLNPKYNQVHIPGANGRGTNYVVTDDRVYIVEGHVCHVLDPATGKNLLDIELPKSDGDQEESWGYIGVYKDVLIGGLGFARYRQRQELSFEADKKLKSSRAGFGSKSLDIAASVALVGFDRHTGEQLWQADAIHSFWHNGVVAGGEQIYCLDRYPAQVEEALMRRGRPRPDSYRIVALDYRTGKPQWEITEGIFGSWLGYSEQHDLLLQAGAAASDRLYGEPTSGMAVYSAADGSLRWQKESLKYSGPCILHNDLIITNANSYSESAGAFYLRDGKQKLVPNPITGELQPWKLSRAYGCNNIIASENLLTFRSGAAGYYDLLTDSGTGNLGGFKSGCTSNLVVANGVLNAPDYTRTCSCAYQNQTSLALVHMPDVDLWSVNTAASVKSQGTRVERVGINFGAPGDRRDAQGLLWLEHPVAAGDSPPISIEVNNDARYYRHHSSTMSGAESPWIAASGIENVTDVRIGMKLRDESDLESGISISDSDDDAEESEEGDIRLRSRSLKLGEDTGRPSVGLRFNNIKLERNAKIRSAYIQFTCDAPGNKPTSLIIAAEDSADAEQFDDDDHDLSSRTLTAAEVGWDVPDWKRAGEAGKPQQTPDLSSLIESVISRSDWQSGNSLAFLFSGSGSRSASAWRDGGRRAARLLVETEQAAKPKRAERKKYRVRLHFGLPSPLAAEDPDFDVYLQDQRVLERVRLQPSGAEGSRFAVETIENVAIGDELRIRFDSRRGKPVLSGIEIVRQAGRQSQ